ncbi:MAG: hypothetical protein WA687_06315 [Solirubrobacterales bacterium]
MATGIEDLDPFQVADVDPVVCVSCGPFGVDRKVSTRNGQPRKLAIASAFDSSLTGVAGINRTEISLCQESTFFHFGPVDIAAEHEDEVAVGIELLHTPIAEVDSVNASDTVDSNTQYSAELADPRTKDPLFASVTVLRDADLKLVLRGDGVIPGPILNHVPAPSLNEFASGVELDDTTTRLVGN